jgi:hypothetical protein
MRNFNEAYTLLLSEVWGRGHVGTPISKLKKEPTINQSSKQSSQAGEPTPEELKLLQRLHNSSYNPRSTTDQKNLTILRQAGNLVGGYQNFKKLVPTVYGIQYGNTPKGKLFRNQAAKMGVPISSGAPIRPGGSLSWRPGHEPKAGPTTSAGGLSWGSALGPGGTGKYSTALQKNANPIIYPFWDALKSKYPDVKDWGIWGDAAHRRRKSDHNTGDAIDIGINNTNEGQGVFNDVIASNQSGKFSGYIKYVIYNGQIWSPEKGLRAYKGKNPHSNHVHVSFYRTPGAGGGVLAAGGATNVGGGSLSWSSIMPEQIQPGQWTPALATGFGYVLKNGRLVVDTQDNQYGAIIKKSYGPDLAGASLSKAALNAWGLTPQTAKDYDVIVKSGNKTIRVPIIDLGPAEWVEKRQGHTIDLTGAAHLALGTSGGKDKVTYQVVRRS